MRTRLQILLAAGLLAGAAGVVAVYGTGAADGPEGSAGGHTTHGAAGGGEARPVRLTSEESDRIGMTLATVERATLGGSVRAVGWVSFDETRLHAVNPKIGGWIERLWVDFTGAPVEKDQPLMEIYSPEVVAAQEELILARRLFDELDSSRIGAFSDAESLLISARRRLEYWDIPQETIERIESTGEIRKALVLLSPASGLVVEKHVIVGDRIQAGASVFRIADLSRVWVEADVFEKDLGLMREGLAARVSVEAYPGESFHGRVTYLYPTVAMGSRTGRIRVDLENPTLSLKPGMYADVEITLPPSPDVLLIPKSSILETGVRAVVFRLGSDGRLHPTEIDVGRRDGDRIEVLAGLAEGDRVVSSANFLIDAESNLSAAMDDMEEGTEEEPGAMDDMDMAAARDTVDDSSHDGSGD